MSVAVGVGRYLEWSRYTYLTDTYPVGIPNLPLEGTWDQRYLPPQGDLGPEVPIPKRDLGPDIPTPRKDLGPEIPTLPVDRMTDRHL